MEEMASGHFHFHHTFLSYSGRGWIRYTIPPSFYTSLLSVQSVYCWLPEPHIAVQKKSKGHRNLTAHPVWCHPLRLVPLPQLAQSLLPAPPHPRHGLGPHCSASGLSQPHGPAPRPPRWWAFPWEMMLEPLSSLLPDPQDLAAGFAAGCNVG